MPDTIFCPNCGERISALARFCASCGARQEEFAVPPVDAAPPTPPSGLWSAGGPDAPAPPPPPPPPAAAPPPPREEPARAEPPPLPPRQEPAAAEPPPADEAPARAEAPRSVETLPPVERARPDDPETQAAQRAPSDSGGSPPRDGSPRRPVRERIDPQAAELTGLLREGLALPGIVAAAIAAAISGAVVLVAGLVIALITPDTSIIGAAGFDAGLVKETFRQAVGTLLTAMVEEPELLVSGTRRIHPLLLVAIPLGALILATRSQLHRTEGASRVARLGWASLVAVPFALLMLVFAVIGGESDATRISPSIPGAFGLGLLWGAIGGLIGAATKLGLGTVPPPLRGLTRATLATLRPLAAVLVICTVVGLAGWLVQVGRDVDGVRYGRSAPTALIEEAAFAAEDGIHLTALAAGARFTADADGPLGLPLPVAGAEDVPGRTGTFSVFAYHDAVPAAVLLPALVLLMGLVALGALYAGFAAARAVKAGSLRSAALWGALTGPAWGIAMTVLVIFAGGLFHGDADDTSVFGVFLLGGALFGAAGGALAASGQPAVPEPASSSS